MEWLQGFELGGDAGILNYIVFGSRFVLPLLALVIVIRAVTSLLRGHEAPEQWGVLTFPGGVQMPLMHWENIIGRAVSSDIALKYPTLSRTHAAIIRDAKGSWRVFDLRSKGGVTVNGKPVSGDGTPVKHGAVIGFGGVDAVFLPRAAEEDADPQPIRSGFTLSLLAEFQLLLGLTLCCSNWDTLNMQIPIAFAFLIVLTFVTYAMTRLMQRRGFELETLAFLLCTIGLAVTCSSAPDSSMRQTFLLAAGIAIYFALGWFLRSLERAKKLRWPLAIAGLALLAVNIVFGGTVFGAKNWLEVGGFSFQPSEFVKITFIFAGAATLDRLFHRRNLIMFVAFAGACVGALALMSDFGTALVFFVTYLVIAFMRSGDLTTITLSVAGAGFAGFLAISARSHIAARFAGWRHVWDDVYGFGFQQTRAMAAAASGGLFGVGAGKGWLVNIFAADTDLVFAVISEELGLIIALLAVIAVIVMAIYPARTAARARSSFFVIAACAAGTVFLMQTALNVLGSVDILPFTGVTLPFVSKGGSSLMACWGLLAFIKAADTRRGASFVVRSADFALRRESSEYRDERSGNRSEAAAPYGEGSGE